MKEINEQDIRALVKGGKLTNETAYQRALTADRRLRLMGGEDPALKTLRNQLRELIAAYEAQQWSDVFQISDKQIIESDEAERIADLERQFISRRKELIVSRLKKLGLKQQDLGTLLNHRKSYVSELLNGIRPFSAGDLILIHRLLRIDLKDLFLTAIPAETRKRIRMSVEKSFPHQLKVRERDFDLELVSK